MKLAVISHKLCWPTSESPASYATDGGFPLQMVAIAELFSQTTIVVPCKVDGPSTGLTQLTGQNISVVPLTVPRSSGLRRKLALLPWLLGNAPIIWRQVRAADAVHTPIPGDVGTIGMIFALIQRKPLFVRHCGNWFVQRTAAERLWKFLMEFFAGGRNVMLVTGGSRDRPSSRNANIKWIFSTSLKAHQLSDSTPQLFPRNDKLRLVTASRQEPGKGGDLAIACLVSLPTAVLDLIGDGSTLEYLRRLADELGVADRVTFHGKIKQSDVVSVMKRSDIFCYPTAASEGFPKVVLEALSQGLPVVTTKVSVLPHLLESGCGVVLNDVSPEALAAAVHEISNSKETYERMSRIAVETARAYSLENWRDTIGKSLREGWNANTLEPSADRLRAGRSTL